MKPIKIIIIILSLFYTVNLFSITGDEAVAKFQSRMLGIGKLTGIISWTTESGDTASGSFKYLAPDKIYVKMGNQGGKVIVSNGRKLWIYSPGNNICGIQDLASKSTSGGIAGMTKDYRAIVMKGAGGYTIKLKNNDKAYPEIILFVDSSFFLKKAVLKNKNGGALSFAISNVNWTAAVLPNMFNFSVPSNAQTVNNPLNIK